MNRVWLVCAVVLVALSGSWAMEVFEPVQDSYTGYVYDLFDTFEIWYADENFGDLEHLEIHRHWGWLIQIWIAYIQFDLSSIEPGTEVIKACINVYVQSFSTVISLIVLEVVEEWLEMEIKHNN